MDRPKCQGERMAPVEILCFAYSRVPLDSFTTPRKQQVQIIQPLQTDTLWVLEILVSGLVQQVRSWGQGARCRAVGL